MCIFKEQPMLLHQKIEETFNKLIEEKSNLREKNLQIKDETIRQIKKAIYNESFAFAQPVNFTINQDGKRRNIKLYKNNLSPEYITTQVIKRILDKRFKIKYANRNKITKSLFNTLPATIQMSDFTIIKFDFKNYFNSVSSIYVFEKFLKTRITDREELELTKHFIYSTKYAYAGLCTSNAIAEIIAQDFDKAIRRIFSPFGMIFYERYIDDSILILNQHMNENEVKDNLNSSLLTTFYDDKFLFAKCKTQFNDKKFKFITKRDLITDKKTSFDFLGYEFSFFKETDNKIQIQYGITKEKKEKYNKRIEKIVRSYCNNKSADFNNTELLKHRIRAFSSRVVYITKRFNKNIWNVKGFISNYGELRYLLDTNQIEPNTKIFLKEMIKSSFSKLNVQTPTFLSKSNKFNLYENMKSNRTILLVNHIGYNYKSLVKLCKKINICETNSKGKHRSFGGLVKEYLIKVKVGY